MACAIQLKLSLYGLNPLPVSQDAFPFKLHYF